jgi:hypothetical protein
VIHEHLAAFEASGSREGVLFIGRAQERNTVFRTEKRRTANGRRLLGAQKPSHNLIAGAAALAQVTDPGHHRNQDPRGPGCVSPTRAQSPSSRSCASSACCRTASYRRRGKTWPHPSGTLEPGHRWSVPASCWPPETSAGAARGQLRSAPARQEHPYISQVIHRIVRDPQVREDLGWIRQQSPAASHITLHRTLDVIAWRKQQEHCCQTAHSPEA